jgi:macrolide transport system ATP-binding/permease protein
VLITHDAAVAAHARSAYPDSRRRIVEDSGELIRPAQEPGAIDVTPRRRERLLPDVTEAVKMALRSLRREPLPHRPDAARRCVIGVASVVAMLAIGDGSKQQCTRPDRRHGHQCLLIRPGAPGVRVAGDVATLVDADAAAIAALPNVAAAVPERTSRMTLRIGNIDDQTTVDGTWPGFTIAHDWNVAAAASSATKTSRVTHR